MSDSYSKFSTYCTGEVNYCKALVSITRWSLSVLTLTTTSLNNVNNKRTKLANIPTGLISSPFQYGSCLLAAITTKLRICIFSIIIEVSSFSLWHRDKLSLNNYKFFRGIPLHAHTTAHRLIHPGST